VATASHQVLPLCCSAFVRPAETFAALKAWVIEDLPDRALVHFALNEGSHILPDPGKCLAPAADMLQPVGAEGYV
jgi:hypothetical protein